MTTIYKGLIPEPWVDEARCGPKFRGPELVRFSRLTVTEKLAVCVGCPVKAECYALGKSGTDSDEVYGGRLLRPHQPPGPAKTLGGKPLTGQAKRVETLTRPGRRDSALARELRATGASWDYIRYTLRPEQSINAFYQMLHLYAKDAIDDELRAMVTADKHRRRAEKEVAA